MSDTTEEVERVKFSQVVAGALAAVTAALIGSTMGVAGTVVGAGLASVISTVGGALYLRSIQRTRESVRTVRAKVVGRTGGATVLVTDDPEAEVTTGEHVAATTEPAEEQPEQPTADRPPTPHRRLRWPVLVVTTLAAFALGMLAITGVEWLRGEPLSGGSGTTFGSIVAPQHNPTGDKPDTDSPTTPPPSTTTTSPTTTTPPTTTTDPTTTTTTPPSNSTSTTTTTTPPTTTTTEEPPVGTAPSGP